MNERLKQLRAELGLSMAKFGEQVGISSASVAHFESGSRNPSRRTIADICRAFHASEDWVITGEGEMFLPKSKEEEIAEIAAQMFKADENDFRYRLQKLVTELSEDELELLKELAIKLGEAAKKESPLE